MSVGGGSVGGGGSSGGGARQPCREPRPHRLSCTGAAWGWGAGLPPLGGVGRPAPLAVFCRLDAPPGLPPAGRLPVAPPSGLAMLGADGGWFGSAQAMLGRMRWSAAAGVYPIKPGSVAALRE